MKTRMPPVFKIVERFILKHMKIVFYIKQVLKMAMQQIYLPMLYKRYAGKPVEKGLVIFADAHHEELPFSMRKCMKHCREIQSIRMKRGSLILERWDMAAC